LSPLGSRRIAVIGFGSQGHAQAQNLRDSGLDVIVAELLGIEAWERATAVRIEVLSTSEAVCSADIVQVLVPDELQPQVYQGEMGSYGFSHGFNIHFGQIVPPPYVDVFMVAPKAPGVIQRRAFLEGVLLFWWPSLGPYRNLRSITVLQDYREG
jgi:ketol-acid reductoisomerase